MHLPLHFIMVGGKIEAPLGSYHTRSAWDRGTLPVPFLLCYHHNISPVRCQHLCCLHKAITCTPKIPAPAWGILPSSNLDKGRTDGAPRPRGGYDSPSYLVERAALRAFGEFPRRLPAPHSRGCIGIIYLRKFFGPNGQSLFRRFLLYHSTRNWGPHFVVKNFHHGCVAGDKATALATGL